MPKEVLFPESQPQYVFDQDCLAFPALVDGKSVQCLVSFELLVQRFGAREFTQEAAREAFARHAIEIRAIAQHHIEMGWVNSDNRVTLTTRFTRLGIKYGEDLRKRPRELELAQAATRALAELIGPGGGEVTVEIDREEKDSRSGIVIVLTDENGIAADWFDTKELGPMGRLRIRMARLWGDFLQVRSQKLIQRSG